MKEIKNEKYIDTWRILNVIEISGKYLDVVSSCWKLIAFVLQTSNCCDTFNAVVSFLFTTGTQQRSRRHAGSYPSIHPNRLCAGGKGTVTYWDKYWCSYRGGYWRRQIKISGRVSITIRVCSWWRCYLRRIIYYVLCSQYVCY